MKYLCRSTHGEGTFSFKEWLAVRGKLHIKNKLEHNTPYTNTSKNRNAKDIIFKKCTSATSSSGAYSKWSFFLQLLICYMPFLVVRGNHLLNHSNHQQGMQSSVHVFFVWKVSLCCDSHHYYSSTLQCCEELQARITACCAGCLTYKRASPDSNV